MGPRRSTRSRCFVHILNSLQYHVVISMTLPVQPPSAKQYTDAGLPWFDYYGSDQKALECAKKLAQLDSVAAMTIKKGGAPIPANEPVSPAYVKKLGPGKCVVREGGFRPVYSSGNDQPFG